MTYFKPALFSLALVATNAFAADCTPPEVPNIPDGGSSTMEQMLEGQKAVKAFQAANLEYMNCLEPQLTEATAKATAEGASDEDKAALKTLEESYTGAVSKEEELAGAFNKSIGDYKAANP